MILNNNNINKFSLKDPYDKAKYGYHIFIVQYQKLVR